MRMTRLDFPNPTAEQPLIPTVSGRYVRVTDVLDMLDYIAGALESSEGDEDAPNVTPETVRGLLKENV